MTGSHSWGLFFSGCNRTLGVAARPPDHGGEYSDDPASRWVGTPCHGLVSSGRVPIGRTRNRADMAHYALLVQATGSSSRAISAIPSSIVREWCIEQNFGPHIPQNSALLKYSAGSVSS